jgi:hypothetical protein
MSLFDHFEQDSPVNSQTNSTIFQLDKVQFLFPHQLISSQIQNNILFLGFEAKLLLIDLSSQNYIKEIVIGNNLESIYSSPDGDFVLLSFMTGKNYIYCNLNGLQLLKISGRISAVGFGGGRILVGTRVCVLVLIIR